MLNYNDYRQVFLDVGRYVKTENKNLDKLYKAKQKENKINASLVILETKNYLNVSALYTYDYLDSILDHLSFMEENNDDTYQDSNTADYDDDGNIEYDDMLDWMIKDFEEYMYEGWEQDINFIQNEHGGLDIENIRNASMLLISADWYLKLVYSTKDKSKIGPEILKYIESLKTHMADTAGGLTALTAQSILSLKDATAEDAENASQSSSVYLALPGVILHAIDPEPYIKNSIPNNLSSLEVDIHSMEEIGQVIEGNILSHELCGAVSYAMQRLAHYEDYDPYGEEGLFREAKEMFSDAYMHRLVRERDPKTLSYKRSFGNNRLRNKISKKTRSLS